MAYGICNAQVPEFSGKTNRRKRPCSLPPAKFPFLSGVFPAIPFSLLDMVLLAGVLWLVAKRKDIFYEKNNVLEFKTSVRIKGLLAVLIVLHHLSINTPGTLLFQAFTSIGTMVVAVFFFYSGFGLMESYLKKPNYLRGFFSKRIVKLLIPHCMALLITYYVTLLTQYKLTPTKLSSLSLTAIRWCPIPGMCWPFSSSTPFSTSPPDCSPIRLSLTG